MRTRVVTTFAATLVLAACGDAGGGNAFLRPGDSTAPGAYLLTESDALALDAMHEPYRHPGAHLTDTIGQRIRRASSASIRGYVEFIEGTLRDAMALPPFAAARTFDAAILISRFPNAFADAYQHVLVTSTGVRVIQAQQLLATLCHEMAHSTLNHLLERAEYLAVAPGGAARMQAREATESYLQGSFDAASGVYTHDAGSYRLVRETVDAAAIRSGAVAKRQESEADVVGGMICGEIGMAADEYREALSSLFRDVRAIRSSFLPGGVSARELADGATVRLSATDLVGYLFSTDDHPSDDERVEQLARLAPIIARHHDENRGIAEAFLAGYEGVKSAALPELP